MPPNSSATAPDPAARPWPVGALRAVPGGYDPNRLPFFVPPRPGEQLASWVVRWAHRYQVSPSGLLAALDVGVVAGPAARVERHLARHDRTLAAAAGLQALPASTDETADALTGQVNRYLADYHGLGPTASARARFCPSCLAESGGVWAAVWAAPLHLACSSHGMLLADRCPRCRRARFTTAAWMSDDADPWVCSEATQGEHTARTHYRRCGQDLREVPARRAGPEIITAQQWVIELAHAADVNPHGTVTACGLPTPHRDLFDATLELVFEMLKGTTPLRRPGPSTGPLLSALQAAHQVLGQPDTVDAAAAAEQHGLLHPAGPVTPIAPDHTLTRRRRNPLLAAIRLSSLADRLPPSSQLVFRCGSPLPRYPTLRQPHSVQPAPGQTHLSWLPQQLWPGILTPWIADHDYQDRAAAAMLLAKVGSTRPWQLIAVDLGLPAAFAVHPPNLIRHLKHIDAWPAVLRRLDELASSLETSPPPIDYQRRRWAVTDQALLVEAANQTGLILGAVHGWVSTHLLVELFWQEYTGGDLRLATPTVGTLLDPDLYHDDDGIRAGRLTDPALIRFLEATAYLVANATGGDPGEPLTWQPP